MARRPSSAIHSRSSSFWNSRTLPFERQLLLGEEAGLDPLGEFHLLLGVEQRDLADLLEVVLDRVGGGSGRGDLLGGGVIVVVADDEGLVLDLGGLDRRRGRLLGLRLVGLLDLGDLDHLGDLGDLDDLRLDLDLFQVGQIGFVEIGHLDVLVTGVLRLLGRHLRRPERCPAFFGAVFLGFAATFFGWAVPPGIDDVFGSPTTAVTVSVCSLAAAVVFLAVSLAGAVARFRWRLGAAESAAPTMTVTPSLMRLRKMLWACDIGMSASSNARRTSSGSR